MLETMLSKKKNRQVAEGCMFSVISFMWKLRLSPGMCTPNKRIKSQKGRMDTDFTRMVSLLGEPNQKDQKEVLTVSV